MTAPLVEVQDLRVAFSTGRGTVAAVRGVSFTVAAGECFAIVGESGSGKSVTARTLVGLAGANASVTAGRLRFGGRDLLTLDAKQWRGIRGRDIGFVLQDALVSLDPLRTVRAEVGETLTTHRIVPRRAVPAKVEELLARAGVPQPDERARQHPHELSGGLRQRALIASAIGADPSLLIADEPTTALDVTVQRQILALLDDLRSAGSALLLVSHDLAVVSQLADRIAVMQDGEIVETGTTAEVLEDPTHPYTRRLLAAIPSAHPKGTRLSGTARPTAAATAPTTEDARVVLEGVDLVKHYPTPGGGRRTAVGGVSFSLRAGRALGVVGESGSGKTTLARLALGLVAPDAGEVRLDGELWSSIPERHRRARRTRMQVISQDPLGSFDPRYDVRRIIGEALHAVAVPRGDVAARALRLLDQVGLDAAFLNRHPLQLSGGQRQRVAIARALATAPDVLVCDEPVSALDISIQAQIIDLLGDLRRDLGVSLLFISHDLSVVQHVCDEVLVMTDGRVVESGTVDDVFAAPGHPYTRLLLASSPRLPDRALELEPTT